MSVVPWKLLRHFPARWWFTRGQGLTILGLTSDGQLRPLPRPGPPITRGGCHLGVRPVATRRRGVG